jgi:hypothetical protein
MNKESRREFGFMLGPGRFGSFGLDTRMTAFAAGFTAKAAKKLKWVHPSIFKCGNYRLHLV